MNNCKLVLKSFKDCKTLCKVSLDIEDSKDESIAESRHHKISKATE